MRCESTVNDIIRTYRKQQLCSLPLQAPGSMRWSPTAASEPLTLYERLEGYAPA